MPTGIYKRTKKHKINWFKKGHKRIRTDESYKKAGKKISNALMGEKNPMWGKHHTEKTKRKMSETHKGEKHWNWRGGITEERNKERQILELKLWKKSVWERDFFICQKCYQLGGNLVAHHIFNWNDFLELRFAIDNGITLCKDCHIKFHKRFGWKVNTMEQLKKFIYGKDCQLIEEKRKQTIKNY